MPITTGRNTKLIDAYEAGLRPGVSADSDNRTILQQLADDDLGVLLPDIDMYVAGTVTWSNASDGVGIYGVGVTSRVTQTTSNVKTFVFSNCKGVEIQGVQMLGQNWSEALVANGDYQAINCVDCSDVSIRQSWITGFPAYAIEIEGGRLIEIERNRFTFNETSDSANCDCQITTSSDPAIPVRDVMFKDNWMHSNASGLYFINPVNSAQITGNNHQCLDSTGATVLDASVKAKHGICCQYRTTTGPLPNTLPEHRIQCNGNYLNGSRWANIYINNNDTTDPDSQQNGGFVGTVCNNTIERSGLTTNTGDTGRKQAAITIEQYQQVIVNSNVIRDVSRFVGTDTRITAAIQASSLLAQDNNDAEISIDVSHNDIKRIQGNGIYVRNEVGKVRMCGNSIDCCEQEYIQMDALVGGSTKVICNDNEFTGNNYSSSYEPMKDASALVAFNTQAADITFHGNRIDMANCVVPDGTKFMVATQSPYFSAIGNLIRGPLNSGGSPQGRGFQLDFLNGSGRRLPEVIIKDNALGDLDYAISSGTAATSDGPLVLGDNRFLDNVRIAITSSTDASIYYGRWIDNERVEIVNDDPGNPPGGNWVLYDRWQSETSSYICTKAGAGLDAEWTPISVSAISEAHEYGRLFSNIGATQPVNGTFAAQTFVIDSATCFSRSLLDPNSGRAYIQPNTTTNTIRATNVLGTGEVKFRIKLRAVLSVNVAGQTVQLVLASDRNGSTIFAPFGDPCVIPVDQGKSYSFVLADQYTQLPAGEFEDFQVQIGYTGGAASWTATFHQLDLEIETA